MKNLLPVRLYSYLVYIDKLNLYNPQNVVPRLFYFTNSCVEPEIGGINASVELSALSIIRALSLLWNYGIVNALKLQACAGP